MHLDHNTLILIVACLLLYYYVSSTIINNVGLVLLVHPPFDEIKQFSQCSVGQQITLRPWRFWSKISDFTLKDCLAGFFRSI